jgi:hypothetical protein
MVLMCQSTESDTFEMIVHHRKTKFFLASFVSKCRFGVSSQIWLMFFCLRFFFYRGQILPPIVTNIENSKKIERSHLTFQNKTQPTGFGPRWDYILELDVQLRELSGGTKFVSQFGRCQHTTHQAPPFAAAGGHPGRNWICLFSHEFVPLFRIDQVCEVLK